VTSSITVLQGQISEKLSARYLIIMKNKKKRNFVWISSKRLLFCEIHRLPC